MATLNQQTNPNVTQQISDVTAEQIARNKAAAAVVLLRMCESLQIGTAGLVDKTTLVTRTEQL